jgi:hypothetical protein
MGFDERRREGEERRLRAAEERGRARQGAPADHSIAGDSLSSLVLHLALGGGAAAFGGLLVAIGAIFSMLLVLLVGGFIGAAGVAVIARGVLRQLSGRGARTAAPVLAGADPRLVAAWDAANEAVEGSRALEEGHRLELTAALRGGYDELLKLEEQRPSLVSALNNLPPDGGGEAGDRLHAALDSLDAQRQRFFDDCARLQATIATMAIKGERTDALAELAEVTEGFGHRVAADAEVDRLLARARKATPEGTK